jgi:hypothetical protein
MALGIFYRHLGYFIIIWYIFSGFGIMYVEKSGNPAHEVNAKNQIKSRSKTGARFSLEIRRHL